VQCRRSSMSHPRPALAILAVVGLAITPAGPARAESTVIRDTRIEGATPALGRGYTPAISALHSICFDKMPTTPASYDFDYTFEDVVETTKGSMVSRASSLATYEIDEFVRANTSRSIDRSTTTTYAHHLLAVLVVESYYASIDEAQAELSKDALKLLAQGDVHGFFTSCGTHYVRSLSRRSFFLTLFSYTSTTSKRDREFERRLETQVRKFQGGGTSAAEQEADRKFAEQARTRDLRVVTRSIGLAARKSANMLPFDLASYKQSVKEAFTAAQEPLAGRVVAMEVMPWLSNTRVLVSLDLAAAGIEKDSWIQRKRILADNAEFYIELSRALDGASSQVHRAEACRRELDERVVEGGRLKPRYARARVTSHRTGAPIALSVLLDALSNDNIDAMRAAVLTWRNGRDGKGGATSCLEELERTSLSGRYHNSIPTCEWQRVQLPNAGLIDEYCPANIDETAGSGGTR